MIRSRRCGLAWRAFMLVTLFALTCFPVSAAPRIYGIRLLNPGPVPRYTPFEIAFWLDTVATNPYWPYDDAPPVGVPAGQGVSVDMLILPPGQSDWGQALTLPCFWYQPVVEMGSGDDLALIPEGPGEWRARYAPEEIGQYSYRLRASDASGTVWSDVEHFDAVLSNLSGYCRVGEEDPRFFELSDGTPILSPLVNLEQGQPVSDLSSARAYIPRMAENGIRFVRWFPTGESANYAVAPFGDDIRIAWHFGPGVWVTAVGPDSARSKLFSLRPYYYTSQSVPAISGARYRLSLYAQVEGDQVLRVNFDNVASLDIGSSASSYHESLGQQCDYRQDGWHNYVLEGVATDGNFSVDLRGLYVGTSGPSPYNVERPGDVRVHSVVLQRDESGLGSWGPNLLSRGDPDTHTYVDQRSAALLDEILALSAENGVYHKLPLFHKNDRVLNRFEPDGTIAGDWDGMNTRFYSEDGLAARWYEMAYVRYFVGRWSYSTAIHSLELANENHLTSESYEAGWDLAEYVKAISPRYIMMSNSFWGYFSSAFFQDSTRGQLLDYADQHWYASEEATPQGMISNTWDDSAMFAREAWTSFSQTGYGWGPIVRGECGVADEGTYPQHPDIAQEPMGIYYHKKVWAHVGSLGWTLDGEWYPRLTYDPEPGSFPNAQHDTWRIYAAYDRFCKDEPLNNGQYECIGTDLWGDRLITSDVSLGELRAWGVRDASAGRALLWVDNAQHTWARVHQGQTVVPATGSVTIQGMPPGRYAVTWWDTTEGTALDTIQYNVDDLSGLTLGVADLGSDIALKAVRVGGPVAIPIKQPIFLSEGWNLVSLVGVPQESAVADILSPVANWCDIAWAHDASVASSPWLNYLPEAPPYACLFQTLDETMGFWVHMNSPATLLVVGMSCDTDIALETGWNLVGFPRLDSQSISDATGSIASKVVSVYAWNPEHGGAWECWDAAGTQAGCDLTHFQPGRGYWIEVNAACTWEIP